VKNAIEIADSSQTAELCNPIRDAISQLEQASSSLKLTYGTANTTILNQLLYSAERKFLFAGGLPNRPWYKHMIQAPGIYLGYGADPFPGLSQAIRDNDWVTAEAYAHIIAKVISEVANSLFPVPSGPPTSTNARGVVYTAIALSLLMMLAVSMIVGYIYVRKHKAKATKEARFKSFEKEVEVSLLSEE